MLRKALIVPLVILSATPLSADVEKDLVLGIESVTGLRSAYVHRGFTLADTTLDAQLETEIRLNPETYLGLAAWHAAESSGDFSESAFALDLGRDFENFRLSASLTYRSYTSSPLDSGVDLTTSARWFLSDNWDLGLEASYDFAADAPYAVMEAGWSRPLSEDLYLDAQAGLSAASDYYGRSGLNDFHSRLGLTYNVSSFLSLTPFAGLSLGLGDNDQNTAYAGLWLAVSF